MALKLLLFFRVKLLLSASNLNLMVVLYVKVEVGLVVLLETKMVTCCLPILLPLVMVLIT